MHQKRRKIQPNMRAEGSFCVFGHGGAWCWKLPDLSISSDSRDLSFFQLGVFLLPFRYNLLPYIFYVSQWHCATSPEKSCDTWICAHWQGVTGQAAVKSVAQGGVSQLHCRLSRYNGSLARFFYNAVSSGAA